MRTLTRCHRADGRVVGATLKAGGSVDPLGAGALHSKVGGAYTSTATQQGGQGTTLFSIINDLLHFGVVIVGLDYCHVGQMTLDEITGGSPYSATTIAGGDGSRKPTAK